jgi:putative peptide zinc metalloprotease protein
MPTVDHDSRLELHELVVRDEDEHVIVGRVATAEFVALPPIGRRALELLAQRSSVGEAEAALSAERGTPVDLVGFAGSLVELGFVRAVNGEPVAAEAPAAPSLPWLAPAHCRWLFGRPVKLLYALALAAAAVTVARQPGLVPAYGDFFWSSHTSVVLAVNTLMVVAVVALHELAHLAAARSVGVAGRISLGTRLHLLVAQTDVTGVWALPRRRRYRVYLAGMAWDLLLVSALVLALGHLALPGGLRELLAALVLVLVFGLLGQLQIYLRTDLYFVLADLMATKNLAEDAAAYALSCARRAGGLLRAPARRAAAVDVLRALPPRERRNVRLYAAFMVAGSLVALSVFAAYGLRIVIELYGQALAAIADGAAGGDLARLGDGALTFTVQAGFQLLFVWVLVRNRGARMKAVLARLGPAAEPAGAHTTPQGGST